MHGHMNVKSVNVCSGTVGDR